VLDAGLKAFGMDHGNPSLEAHEVFFCSDEHTTFLADEAGALPAVGERLRLAPAHVDPTVAYHERLFVLDGDDVVDVWEVDLRNW
jgi:D-serine deaminase-like pyridoxal phosphate-dependent protein